MGVNFGEVLEKSVEVYAAVQVAGAQLPQAAVGETIDADIPDIEIRYSKRGKKYAGRIISVVIERDA
jgi:hypothetical protein